MKFKVSEKVSQVALAFLTSFQITIIGYIAYEKFYLGNDVTSDGRESLRTSSLIYGKDTKEHENDKFLTVDDLYKPNLTSRQIAKAKRDADRAAEREIAFAVVNKAKEKM